MTPVVNFYKVTFIFLSPNSVEIKSPDMNIQYTLMMTPKLQVENKERKKLSLPGDLEP